MWRLHPCALFTRPMCRVRCCDVCRCSLYSLPTPRAMPLAETLGFEDAVVTPGLDSTPLGTYRGLVWTNIDVVDTSPYAHIDAWEGYQVASTSPPNVLYLVFYYASTIELYFRSANGTRFSVVGMAVTAGFSDSSGQPATFTAYRSGANVATFVAYPNTTAPTLITALPGFDDIDKGAVPMRGH